MSDTVIVWLGDVVDQMEMQSDEYQAYLNRRTGELVAISEEEVRLAEEADELAGEPGELVDGAASGQEWEDLPAWQAEFLPKASEVLESDDFLPLPSRFDIHEWHIMEDFSRQVDDDAVREALLDAIHGRGAFRLFKATARRLGVIDAWYRYRDAALEEIAVDWLEANDIPYRRGRAGASQDASGGARPSVR